MEAAVKAGAVEQVCKMTGITKKEANSAIEVVLPLLISGMQGQAKNKDTKEGFVKALADHGKDDTSDVKAFLSKVDTDDGAKIVKHLLGSHTEEIAAKAKKKSGLDTRKILMIMAILAPLLMSQMGKTAEKETAKGGSGNMSDVVETILENVDVADVVKIISLLVK